MEHKDFKKINNAFVRDKVSNPKRRIEIELGDTKQPDLIYPQFKTKHWDNEVNFSVRLIDDDYDSAEVKPIEKGIEWSRAGRIARLYEHDLSHFEDGGFEFEVELSEKPKSNVLNFSVQSKGLDFFYQPELTKEEKKNGEERPENVVGSYAVYHKTKKNDYIEGNHYKTGKAFHIYRPWAQDATGKRVWCELYVDEKEAKITIPQEFLDSAIYPILVDPTIGYLSIGASQVGVSSDCIFITNYNNTVGASGFTVGAIFFYGRVTGANRLAQGGVYDTGGNLLGSQSADITVDSTAKWFGVTFSGPALSANTTYYPAVFRQSDGVSTNQMYYDTGVLGNEKNRTFGVTYSTWPNPITSLVDQARIPSQYVSEGVQVLPISVADSVYVVEDTLNQTYDTAQQRLIFGVGGTSEMSAQSFIAMDATLLSIKIKLSKNGTPTDDLIVDIFDSLAGTSLGSVSIPSASLTNGAYNLFTFSSPITLTPGTSYYIQVSRSGTRSISNVWGWFVSIQNPYKDGALYNRNNLTWSVASAVNDGTFVAAFSGNPTVSIVSQSNASINVNDTVTVSESVTILIPVLVPSVNDSVTITESVSFQVFYFISTSDAVTVTESVTIIEIKNLSVSDTVTVTDVPTIGAMVLPVSGVDGLTVSESISFITFDFLSVSDSISITESVSLAIAILGTVSDSITISESVSILEIFNPSVSDAVTISDVPTVFLPILTLSVFDSVSVVENISTLLLNFNSVSDSITVTESITVTITSPSTFNGNYWDDVTVSESVSILIKNFISVSDAISISENVVIQINAYFISVFDTVTVVEALVYFGDTVIVGEVISIFIQAGGKTINLSDSLTVTESVTIFIPILTLSVSDTITVTESEAGIVTPTPFVSDSIGVTESVTIALFSFINVSDSITVTESIQIRIGELISLSDSITVTDVPTIFLPFLSVNVSDSVSVAEVATISGLPNQISVSDSVSISESVTLSSIGLQISVSDSVTISESRSLVFLNFISVFDSVSHTEFVTNSIVSGGISTFDIVTISESVTIKIAIKISVFETVTISEFTAIGSPVSVSVSNVGVRLGWHFAKYVVHGPFGDFVVKAPELKKNYKLRL